MIRHIIIWDLKDDLSDEDKNKYPIEIKQKLEALKGVVPGLLDIKVVIDLLDTSKGDILLVEREALGKVNMKTS